jgi:hypothetical protein
MAKVKVTAEYKGHPVLVGEHTEFAYNEKHLENNLQLMKSITDRHNKVYSWRMDLRMPDEVELDKPPKQVACNFMSSFCKKLARRKIDSEYIMKMEKETSENEHFHIQMFVNGSKVKDHKEIVEEGEALLAKQLGLPEPNNGLLEYKNIGKKKKSQDHNTQEYNQEDEKKKGKRNGIKLYRNLPSFEKNFDRCFKEGSYLAKQRPTDKVDPDERKVCYSLFRNKRSRSSK